MTAPAQPQQSPVERLLAAARKRKAEAGPDSIMHLSHDGWIWLLEEVVALRADNERLRADFDTLITTGKKP